MSFSSDIIISTFFVFILLYLLINKLAKTPRHVCVVVLGDIGRSPRMQYHALSFAEEGFRVYLVGYKGSTPHEKVLQNENIQIYHVAEHPAFISRIPKIFGYFVKAVWQTISLGWTLLLLPNLGSILIQNPPSIPTMAVSYVISHVRFCTLVIDWHNYGYTILSMSLRQGHPFVKFAKWYEKICGRLSSYNLCVTDAMLEDLKTNWNISAISVHDRPSEIFQSITIEQQHDLFSRLSKNYPLFASKDSTTSTRFTTIDKDNKICKASDRPALLVSSTSWTEDEDFGILLEALTEYDSSDLEASYFPNIVCVITGKGPQKEMYSKKIEERSWNRVQFCLPWLAAEDYPLMLGSADIGVCLHKSSSGLDLPMKVVDMFGCGLPVCALNFACIGELVQHHKNGLIFNDSDELFIQLMMLLRGFLKEHSMLSNLRKNLVQFQEHRWHNQWKQLVLPIFNEIAGVRNTTFNIPQKFGNWSSDQREEQDTKKSN
ncbi:chitobiosyldiphosphodolichol beta-mannosyltransferase-like [Physella acuta]|uniref:chitobiosyldiphosphodolichol beta-mannosyltransferase-like n=1 Tax=Physella acuta TaxID=109671 RepID=UPI0027DB309A|nr:chitobiosyldiphosphodolichol beta-mannosyltransferase-like [Physella acuta]